MIWSREMPTDPLQPIQGQLLQLASVVRTRQCELIKLTFTQTLGNSVAHINELAATASHPGGCMKKWMSKQFVMSTAGIAWYRDAHRGKCTLKCVLDLVYVHIARSLLVWLVSCSKTVQCWKITAEVGSTNLYTLLMSCNVFVTCLAYVHSSNLIHCCSCTFINVVHAFTEEQGNFSARCLTEDVALYNHSGLWYSQLY